MESATRTIEEHGKTAAKGIPSPSYDRKTDADATIIRRFTGKSPVCLKIESPSVLRNRSKFFERCSRRNVSRKQKSADCSRRCQLRTTARSMEEKRRGRQLKRENGGIKGKPASRDSRYIYMHSPRVLLKSTLTGHGRTSMISRESLAAAAADAQWTRLSRRPCRTAARFSSRKRCRRRTTDEAVGNARKAATGNRLTTDNRRPDPEHRKLSPERHEERALDKYLR